LLTAISGQHANSPHKSIYCYKELIISSSVVALNIASTHWTYPQIDSRAELAWLAWFMYICNHPSSQHGATVIMCAALLGYYKAKLSQTLSNSTDK